MAITVKDVAKKAGLQPQPFRVSLTIIQVFLNRQKSAKSHG